MNFEIIFQKHKILDKLILLSINGSCGQLDVYV